MLSSSPHWMGLQHVSTWHSHQVLFWYKELDTPSHLLTVTPYHWSIFLITWTTVAKTIYFNLKSQIQLLFLISKLVAHNHFQVLKTAGTREMLSKLLKMLCWADGMVFILIFPKCTHWHKHEAKLPYKNRHSNKFFHHVFWCWSCVSTYQYYVLAQHLWSFGTSLSAKINSKQRLKYKTHH